MQIPASIFKAYDIRGVVGDTLTVAAVDQIGQAIASTALAKGEHAICIGYDGRLSSPMLAEALTTGLLRAGIEVIQLGMITTPMLYFACHNLAHTSSGVMITGSHNPPAYNGLKIVIAGETLSSEAIQAIKRRIDAQDLYTGEGRHSTLDIAPAYQAAIINDIHLQRPMRIVVDCGNGIAGAYAPTLFEALGCQVTPLFCEVDGHFPNHHPDPVEDKNLQDVIDALRKGDAEIGLAFDGDGDRLGVVTREGQIIRCDRLLMLLSTEVLKAQPGAKIVFDVKSTRHLPPWIVQHGGQPVMWKTGHSLMKAKIRETGAALGGELSGHLFFNDQKQGRQRWPGFDDGLYSAARLLEILSCSQIVSSIWDSLPDSLNTPELHIAMTEGEPHQLIIQLQKNAYFPEAINIVSIDGLRVEYADGFGLIRASNTTPVLTIRFEADHAQALERIQKAFKQRLHQLRPDLKIPF